MEEGKAQEVTGHHSSKTACLLDTNVILFSCPGSSIPDLGQSVSDWVSAILTQRVTFETSDPSDI